MTGELEARLERLESRLAYQEDLLAELNAGVAALRETLDLQQGQLRLLWHQLQERDVREPRNPADEIPPHF